jgi:hypothetical protein
MKSIASLREAAANVRRIRTLWRSERRYRGPATWRQRWGFWNDGFLTESAMQYGFHDSSVDRRLYVSDWQRALRMYHLNDPYSAALDNKYLFDRMVRPISPELLPTLHGLLSPGGVLHLEGLPPVKQVVDWLIQETARSAGVVIKPVDGGAGIGVLIFRSGIDGMLLNGKPIAEPDLTTILTGQAHSIVTRFEVQHDYAARIAPFASNTMRILTYWDDELGSAALGRAVHRFGGVHGDGIDNVSQGGVTVFIDPLTGIMGRGAEFTPSGPRWHEVHPDTQAPVTGVGIPEWGAITARLLELHSRLAFLPWIGWDVLMTAGGPKLIEANRFSGVILLQVHGPLRRDNRLEKFLLRHRVVTA